MTFGALTLTGLAVYHFNAASEEALQLSQFMEFKTTHNKEYDSLTELEYRFGVFKQSLAKIKEINSNPQNTFTAGINKFSDLTWDEFKNKMLMTKTIKNEMSSTEEFTNFKTSNVDWRTAAGAVQPVKNQNPCGSCYAFSAICAMEFAYWKTSGKSVSLSEQEIVDCSRRYYNAGCEGGLPSSSFNYIIDRDVATEVNYPYLRTDNPCNAANVAKSGRESLSDYKQISPGVNNLVTAVESDVVSVGFEALDDFKHYHSGIYNNNDPSCGNHLNHAMNVVGFNTASSSPYFMVRNSWGGNWGEDGYIRVAIARGNGTCGIAGNYSTVPLV